MKNEEETAGRSANSEEQRNPTSSSTVTENEVQPSSEQKASSENKESSNNNADEVLAEMKACISIFTRTINTQHSTASCSKPTKKILLKNIINDVIDMASTAPTTSSQAQHQNQDHVEGGIKSDPEIGSANREYQVYRSVGGGIINSTNAMHEEHFIRQTASLKSLKVPPSYSQALKIGRALPHARSSIDAFSSVPFIIRQPPPSYAEVQGVESEELSMISDESFIFGPDPIYMICPRCRTMVFTEVRTETSPLSHITSAVLCVCLCWPCFWIPYCLKSCKFTYHTCPRCNYYFGMYQPW